MRTYLRHAVAGTAAVASLVALATPANATIAGVDACQGTSAGADSDCVFVALGGFYRITAAPLIDGPTWARVGCNPSGAGGEAAAWEAGTIGIDRVYLPAGVCTLRVWSQHSGAGSVVRDG